MGFFSSSKSINPATGQPRSMDKELGADKKGMAQRKADLDARVARANRHQQQRLSRKKSDWN